MLFMEHMKIRRLLVVLVSASVIATGAYLALRPSTVVVIRPTLSSITQSVLASGQVMPPAEVKLGSLVSSTALEVFVREGESIIKGQTLASLNASEARAALEQAQAQLSAASAGRSELRRSSAPTAAAQLRNAEASLTQAKKKLARERELFNGGITTQAALDELGTQVQIAQAQKDAAILQLRAASAGGTQSLSVAANIASAQAQLAVAQERLSRHTIVSPTDGIILVRTVEPGDVVMTGASLFVISATGATRLKIEPDERNLAFLEIDQGAIAASEAFPDRQFSARVQHIAPSIDPQRGTVEVRLLVDDPPKTLRPHMTVSVEVRVAEKPSALLLPRRSVVNLTAQPNVWIVDDGRLQSLDVALGIRGDDKLEISAGLTKDTLVVLEPENEFSNGTTVRSVISTTSGEFQ